jgi:hypothetical protein
MIFLKFKLSINFGKYYQYKGGQDSIIGTAARYRLHG